MAIQRDDEFERSGDRMDVTSVEGGATRDSTAAGPTPLSARLAIKALLMLMFLLAYLNPVLRSAPEAQVTPFRLLFPLVAGFMFVRYARRPVTRGFALYICLVFAYCLAQITVAGLLTDTFVWSYLINILALVVFLYFVYMYRAEYGTASLHRHLYLWYKVMVVLSVHQVLTGFHYPNAYFQSGYAQIYFGQQNDASLAIAAFIPILLTRGVSDGRAMLWLLAGFWVLFTNNTRGVLVAVAAYVLIVIGSRLVRTLNRLGLSRRITAVILVTAAAIGIFLLKGVEISLADEVTTLDTAVIGPLTQMVKGEQMTEQLTSINLRVTLAIAGAQHFAATYGFGVGPGASTYFVRELYPGVALSMHIFPLQLLTELGWLFAGTFLWIVTTCGPKIGWNQFVPLMLFCIMVTASITSGAITNYFFFACALLMLSTPDLANSWRRVRAPRTAPGGGRLLPSDPLTRPGDREL